MPLPVLTPELVDAYLATEYRVTTPDSDIMLSPGTRSGELQDLLTAHGVETCALLTAFNPYSALTSEIENRQLQASLEREINKDLICLESVGADLLGLWPGEPGVLVLGMSFEMAAGLASRYRQNAFIFGDADGNVHLICTIHVRTGPGGIWWTRYPDGTYIYRSFVLGGCGKGTCGPASIAGWMINQDENYIDTLLQVLDKAGWHDVHAELNVLTFERRLDKYRKSRHATARQLEFAIKHAGKDYWYFREMVYNNLTAGLSGPPESWDISIRQMHYAAQHMVDTVARRDSHEQLIHQLDQDIAAMEEQIEQLRRMHCVQC